KSSHGNPHAVGTTEAAELPSPFEVRLEVEEHSRYAPPLELSLELGETLLEVGKNPGVAAVSLVGGHKVLKGLLIDVPLGPVELGIEIVLHVHPAQAWFHCQVLLKRFVGGVPLTNDVPPIENCHHGGMVDAAMEFRHQLS